jgi:hypothetical protein
MPAKQAVFARRDGQMIEATAVATPHVITVKTVCCVAFVVRCARKSEMQVMVRWRRLVYAPPTPSRPRRPCVCCIATTADARRRRAKLHLARRVTVRRRQDGLDCGAKNRYARTEVRSIPPLANASACRPIEHREIVNSQCAGLEALASAEGVVCVDRRINPHNH